MPNINFFIAFRQLVPLILAAICIQAHSASEFNLMTGPPIQVGRGQETICGFGTNGYYPVYPIPGDRSILCFQRSNSMLYWSTQSLVTAGGIFLVAVYWTCGDLDATYVGSGPVWTEYYNQMLSTGGVCVKYQQEEKTKEPSCSVQVGDPINPLTGVKRQAVSLLDLPSGDVSIQLTYDSTGLLPVSMSVNGAPATGNAGWLGSSSSVMGPAWFINSHRRYFQRGAAQTGEGVDFGNGTFGASSSIDYDAWAWYDASGLFLSARAPNRITDDESSFERIGTLTNYQIRETSRKSIGRGGSNTFRYSDASTPATIAPKSGLLIAMADRFGREVGFRYKALPNGAIVLAALIDPSSAEIKFSYNQNYFLESIEWQDGSRQGFLYEDAVVAGALTKIVDELGQPFNTNTYYPSGHVQSTQNGSGFNKYSVAYSVHPEIKRDVTYTYQGGTASATFTPPQGVVVTGPNGVQSQFSTTMAANKPRVSAQSQPAGAGCGAASTATEYGVNGTILSEVDFRGSKTCYGYVNSTKSKSVVVEGLSSQVQCASVLPSGATLPIGARKTSFADYKNGIPRKIARPGMRSQIFDDQSNQVTCSESGSTDFLRVCKYTETATTDANGALGFDAVVLAGSPVRTKSFTYNKYNQVLTETDPNGNLTAYEYFADSNADHHLGDLRSVTNALGQVTNFKKYNPMGQVLEKLDANQVATVYTYDQRHRLKTLTVAGSTTSYDYFPTGLLRRVLQPDGSFTAYEYDDAHRLIAVSDSQGNRIEYTLDNAGNKVSEKALDPNGLLARQVDRVMDALGRVQQTTGRE